MNIDEAVAETARTARAQAGRSFIDMALTVYEFKLSCPRCGWELTQGLCNTWFCVHCVNLTAEDWDEQFRRDDA